jgi:hypothetical protein
MDLCHIEIVTSEKDVPSSVASVVSICVCCVCVCVVCAVCFGEVMCLRRGKFEQERQTFLNY